MMRSMILLSILVLVALLCVQVAYSDPLTTPSSLGDMVQETVDQVKATGEKLKEGAENMKGEVEKMAGDLSGKMGEAKDSIHGSIKGAFNSAHSDFKILSATTAIMATAALMANAFV